MVGPACQGGRGTLASGNSQPEVCVCVCARTWRETLEAAELIYREAWRDSPTGTGFTRSTREAVCAVAFSPSVPTDTVGSAEIQLARVPHAVLGFTLSSPGHTALRCWG